MPTSNEVRITKRFIYSAQFWETINFKDLKMGDIFKLYEPDGTPVPIFAQPIGIATSDAYLTFDTIWTIQCKGWKEAK